MRKTVIYIAGYGRSGSTLLDIILGNNSFIVNTGELYLLFEEVLLDDCCSCGEQYTECNFWSKFVDKAQELGSLKRLRSIFHKVDRRETIYAPWKKHISQKDQEIYKCTHDKLFNCLETQVILDSSKTASLASYRPVALKDLCDYDVKVIHVQRRFLDVLKSLNKGSNRKMQNKDETKRSFLSQLVGNKNKRINIKKHSSNITNTIRGALGYYLANRDARKLKSYIGKDNYLHITFENLVNNPIDVLHQVEVKFNLDLSENATLIKNNDNLQTGHLAGGNRMAKQKEISIRELKNLK